MTYDELLEESVSQGLRVKEKSLLGNKGRIKENKIAIKKDIPTLKEKSCVLAEELGHYYTTIGDIINLQDVKNLKQELKARLWAYDKQVGLLGIINAYEAGCTSIYAMAEFLNVTEEFLADALKCYKSKYGICTKLNNYIIYFEPTLGICKMLNEGK